MKNFPAKSFFKTVTAKNSDKYGEKRPDLEWTYEGVEIVDLQNMDEEQLAKVAVLANNSIEQYGRKLILQNADNWDFDPSDVATLDKVYDDLTSETTRKRRVTKETLAKCGEFYARWAELIGKNTQAANAGMQVIAQKLVPIAANAEALERMRDNILGLLEKAAEESESNISLAEQLEENMDCLEWIVDECDKMIEDSKKDIADSL